MKEAHKVLFISQEITPYLPESDMSLVCRKMPQLVQEAGREMRVFMPRFGCVNERRNQLHEVIRLSGMNLIIDDTDHPLIIKVASIQAARMQVYFIDNEDFFQRKFTVKDANGKDFDDNDERTIFFSRGVLETVKKLQWAPDVIHCHGWLNALVPIYIKKVFCDDPYFKDTKIVVSLYNKDYQFSSKFNPHFNKILKMEGITDDDVNILNPNGASYNDLMKLAMQYSEGVIYTSDDIDPDLKEFADKKGLKQVTYIGTDDIGSKYMDFYDSLFD